MLEEVIRYNELYDFYKDLLTDKQKKYYEDYYFKNMSLQEMKEEYNVSRNAIYKQLKNILKKLDNYEEVIGIVKKKNTLKEITKNIKDKELKEKLDKLFLED